MGLESLWLDAVGRLGLIDCGGRPRASAISKPHKVRLRQAALAGHGAIAFGGPDARRGRAAVRGSALGRAVARSRFAIVLTMVAGFTSSARSGRAFPGCRRRCTRRDRRALGAGIASPDRSSTSTSTGRRASSLGRPVQPRRGRCCGRLRRLVLLAILVPAWLLGEWSVAVRYRFELDGDWRRCGRGVHDGPDLFHAREGRRVVRAGAERCSGLAA